MWRADLKAEIHFVNSSNRRLCSITPNRVCTDAYKPFLICVYKPYESDDAAQDEYSSVLADVMAIADRCDH